MAFRSHEEIMPVGIIQSSIATQSSAVPKMAELEPSMTVHEFQAANSNRVQTGTIDCCAALLIRSTIFPYSRCSNAGVKMLAICDVAGYCFVSSVEGGFSGDPKLRKWSDCPLGRTTRHVLHVLLDACKEFGDKIDGSGVHIAMDNYFTSPTLFECLAGHDIFAVGTCRVNRTAGAIPFLQSLDRIPVKRGDMNFARAGNVAFVQWLDSKDIILCSTIHLAQPRAAIGQPKKEDDDGGDDHFAPLPYR